MSLVTEQNIFMADVGRLVSFIQNNGHAVTGGELWRPDEMQKIYQKQGKSSPNSKNVHGDRLAVDLNIFQIKDGKSELTYSKSNLQFIGDYWESLDKKNRWGGNFKSFIDTPHFERKV